MNFRRLPSDASLNTAKCSSPPSTAAPSLLGEPVSLDFKGCILSKPHVNENNNLTNSCGGILSALRSQAGHDHPMSRLSPSENSKNEEVQATPVDEDDVDEEEEDSRGSAPKPLLSPILSAPTTIRFPARAPEKDRSRTADSGNCRWDKCEVSFESVSGLLEHLQVRTQRQTVLARLRKTVGTLFLFNALLTHPTFSERESPSCKNHSGKDFPIEPRRCVSKYHRGNCVLRASINANKQ